MDFALNDEQNLMGSALKRFVEKEVRPAAGDADRTGEMPARLLLSAEELGFFCDAVPEEADGLLDGAYSHLNRAIRGFELGRGCAAVSALLESNVESALAVGKWGSASLKRTIFESMTNRGIVSLYRDSNGALEVTDAGKDLRVTGTVGPAVGLADADHVLVLSDHGETPAVFILPIEQLARESWTPSGWRAARWGSIACDSVLIPETQILARGPDAHASTTLVLTWLRTSLAARAVGVADRAIECARGYAEERIQFGKPIGAFESLRTLRDENETMISAARLLALRAAWEIDHGLSTASDTASRARDLAADVVGRATVDALQIYGGYGFVNDYPVEKLMRDAPVFAALCGEEGLFRNGSTLTAQSER